jgi:hypothetical protein
MSAFPIKRTPEQGHTRQCHARVMMLCLMGWTQDDSITDYEYRTYVQDNGAMHEADDLLRDGNVECLCEPLEPPSSWTYAPWPDEPMEVPC